MNIIIRAGIWWPLGLLLPSSLILNWCQRQPPRNTTGWGDIAKSPQDLWTNLLKTESARKRFFILLVSSTAPNVIEEVDFLIEAGISIYKLNVIFTLIFNNSTSMRAVCSYQWTGIINDLTEMWKYIIALGAMSETPVMEKVRKGFILSDDATLIMVNLFIRSFAKIDDVKMEYSVQITFR